MPCLRIEYVGPKTLYVWHFPSSPEDWEGRLKAARWGQSKHVTVRNMPSGNYVIECAGPDFPIAEKHPGSDWQTRIRYFAGTEDEKIRPNL